LACAGPSWAGDPADTGASEIEPQSAETAAPFDIEAATEAYLSSLTPEEKARSDSYFEGGYWLQLWTFLLTLLVAWILLASKLSVRMRDLTERLTRRKPIQTMLYVLLYAGLVYLLQLPFTLYRDFFRERHYALLTQSFGPWLRDSVVGLLVNAILLSVLAAAVYGVIRRSPKRWWA
jgi:STE24 endopeptidase